jgi:hemolysin activation/secretion protein
MQQEIHKLSLAACLLFLVVVAPAQTMSEEIQRRQQQDAQELLRERRVGMDERALQTSAQTQEQTASAATALSEEGCLDLQKINISGAKKLNIKKIQKKARKAAGKCVRRETLQQMQNDIQQAYINKGYISARVYFDFRDIGQKQLNIMVEEGMLEEVILLDPKTKEPQKGASAALQKFTAFPFTRGRILDLRRLEQGIEQMNKLSSSRAVMDVRPGKNEGGSIVVIDNEPLPRNSIDISYDNNGTKTTGVSRVNTSYSRDNLLSLNENIYINASTTIGEDPGTRYSRSFVAAYTMPFGYFTLNNSFNYSRYLSTTPGLWADVESSGNSMNIISSLEYTFARGRSYKTSLGAQLAYKESRNYVEAVYIDTASRILSIGTLFMTGTYYSPLGSFYSKLSLNQGLNILGANKDEISAPGMPQAQYTSAGLYLNYSGNIKMFNYSASFDGQYGFDDMFGSEQTMIGGGSVRGFKEGSASGESGLIIRQDLKAFFTNIFGRPQNKYVDMLLGGLYAGVFADYGYVAPKTYGKNTSLAGCGAKIGYYGKYLTADFGWARALIRPDYIRNEGNIFYLNASLNVAL